MTPGVAPLSLSKLSRVTVARAPSARATVVPSSPAVCRALPFLLIVPLTLALTACGPPSQFASIRDATVIGGPGQGEGFLHQPRGIEAFADDASCVVIDRSGRIQHFAGDGELLSSWYLPEWREGQPIDVTQSPWGTLIVGDTHYGRVLEFSRDGRELRRFGEEANLELVRGVAVSSSEIIYVADYGEFDRIHRFARDGAYLGAFGEKGDGPNDFLRPEGLAIGASGDLFVVDCGHHRILRFGPEGEPRGGFGSMGEGPGQFLFPFDIAAGSDETLYVVDYKGNRIQRFREDGTFLGAAGGAGRQSGRFATPRGVAVTPRADGDIVFVADTYNHRVQRFAWEFDL